MPLSNVEFVKIVSSNLDFIGHADNSLYIGFKGGSVYRYFDADKQLFEGMLASPSKGKYFHAAIRNKLKYEKLTIPEGTKIKFKLMREDGTPEIVESRIG